MALLPLLAPDRRLAGGLAQPAVPLPAGTACRSVDEQFQAAPSRAALLVTAADRPGQVGLVPRARFLHQMAGPFGFGRALYGRRPVGELALWDPVVVDAAATVQQAATAVLQRRSAARYDELVVRFPDGTWGTLTAAAVLEALSRDLAELALYDRLTGLANREVLLAQLAQHCTPASPGTVLLFVDLDRFKQVNDAHGHNAGDLLLQAVAGRLQATARPTDTAARLGGDEFAVLLTDLPAGPDQPTQAAEAVAHRLLTEINRPVLIGGHSVRVGASIGVAIAARTGSDPDTLLREADLAMYRAKHAGGDRICTVNAVGCQLEPPRLTSLGIDDSLPRALARDEFVLHYQPILELSSGATASAEALIRWQHPQHGLLSPSEFLPAAEASGLIVQLDRWVLRQACAQLAQWDDDAEVSAPSSINVNLSTPHLAHPQLLQHVTDALRASGVAPHRLRLELPETATLAHLQAARDTLTSLRTLGIYLTLDDLGAGSSTLRHLSDLPLDGVKIDRSFISTMLTNDRDAAIVRLLIDLAHNLNLRITAEGIETPEQLQALQALGCSHGQGFHIGRPQRPDGATPHWLARASPEQHNRSTPPRRNGDVQQAR